jgi:hypothetical protein
MNLEEMQKQLEDIQQMDISNLTPEQLTEVLNTLSTIMAKSEESLINTTLIEINQIENNNDEDNN